MIDEKTFFLPMSPHSVYDDHSEKDFFVKARKISKIPAGIAPMGQFIVGSIHVVQCRLPTIVMRY